MFGHREILQALRLRLAEEQRQGQAAASEAVRMELKCIAQSRLSKIASAERWWEAQAPADDSVRARQVQFNLLLEFEPAVNTPRPLKSALRKARPCASDALISACKVAATKEVGATIDSAS